MDINIVDNQAVFEVYLGLTASGYHLANPERAGAIISVIAGGTWSQQVVNYFRQAYIDDGRLNPYWPRASILTAVSLLTQNTVKEKNSQLIRVHLSTMNNISTKEADDATVEWAVALPNQVISLRNSAGYPKARECYRDIVRTELKENGLCYKHGILAAYQLLQNFVQLPLKGIEVVTVLNPLQADPLTDIVKSGDQLNIITSHLRVESYVHELIHVLLDPYLRDWTVPISQHFYLLDPVYEPMIFLRYAWDRSAASWYNVFSETLVRVLAVMVSENDSRASLVSRIQTIVEAGFIYAMPIFRKLAENESPAALSYQWLDGCLQACLTVAKPHME